MFDPRELSSYPPSPGVYLMRNGEGHLLYIGKAKNLRQRLRSYFASRGDERPTVPFLVEKVATIETIVVGSEEEALLLESNLIKRKKPHYNVLLKDDKSYPAIVIDRMMKWPRIDVRRMRFDRYDHQKGKKVFGPYPQRQEASLLYELLSDLFPLRRCSDQEFAHRQRPCILHEMGKCLAPCVGYCSSEEYSREVDKAISLLEGKNREILSTLISWRDEAAIELQFERAERLHKAILRFSSVKQQVVEGLHHEALDVYGLYTEQEHLFVCRLSCRQGAIMASQTYHLRNRVNTLSEALESFLAQLYTRELAVATSLLLPIQLDDKRALMHLLQTSSNGMEIAIIDKAKGTVQRSLLTIAESNAREDGLRMLARKKSSEELLSLLQEELALTHYPEQIDCADISHLAGSACAGSLISYRGGEHDAPSSRIYYLKESTPGDDYGAMEELLRRRFDSKESAKRPPPDLLIIDGGAAHLQVASAVLERLDIVTVDLIALSKEEGRHDKGLRKEVIHRLGKPPLGLPASSQLLLFLQRIRDDAHRWAMRGQRQRHKKELMAHPLEGIPGIGLVKRQKILRHFGSALRLLDADRMALEGCPGLTEKDHKQILEWISKNRTNHPAA